jgi:glycosyltransferase involved in cell wall biosynthesis
MKVLHLGKYFPPIYGGIETVSYDIVTGLNENGIETDIICFNTTRANQVENLPYKIYRVSMIRRFFSTPISFSLFGLLKGICKKYDIIHIHLPNPWMGIALLFSGYEGKIVLHWHSDIIKQKYLRTLYKPFQEWLIKKSSKIIVTSENYLKGSNDLKKYRNKCIVIPIGIVDKSLTYNSKKRIGTINNNKKNIVFAVGRLVYYKGFEYLIKAAKKLPDNYIVLIAGSGPLEKTLIESIEEMDLGAKIKLLGQIPDDELNQYFIDSDVFVLPSIERSEAFGVVLLEAMSFSKPLITTDIQYSGVSYVNKENITGLVVPIRNSDKIAEAIIDIVENDEKRKQFARNSRERFLLHFTKEKMVKKTISLYNELCQA